MARIIFSLMRKAQSYVQRWKNHLSGALSMSRLRYFTIFRNFDARHLVHYALTLPNSFMLIWLLVLLWGEVWIFQSYVKRCDWSNWEKWPKDASPHHLIFLADPQIIDPHSYPSRPRPLDWLTTLHTDKYLERSYTSLQKILHPDTIFFLGDLFDGGREWKTFRGDKEDAQWSDSQRPPGEQTFAKKWATKYDENFWLHEYDRFGKIFYKLWNTGGLNPGPWQRGRKIISSLPGNHDLGFGDKVKVSIRSRFQAYFGDLNRVDIIGNHTFVSVDSVSLSAGESSHNVKAITRPVEEFLATVQVQKRRAVARELGYMTGRDSLFQFPHKIENLATVNLSALSSLDPGPDSPEFPTILLTHVPLFREPGTPCGPLRERWPPTTPPKGQQSPVNPDERNAISISRGYQYQNVLSPSDSIKLISSVGNVVSVFSGDDHDYCEIEHPADKNNVKEITVKSISWAMGVRRPGFLLLSMWNPIDDFGKPLHNFNTASRFSASQVPLTTQSYLCLLPDQIGIFIVYICLILVTLFTLSIRSILTPIQLLGPFPSRYQTHYLPMTENNNTYHQKVKNLFRSSFSFTSPGRAVNLASRFNMGKTSTNNEDECGVSSDYQMWSSPVSTFKNPIKNSVTSEHGENNNEVADRYCDHYKSKRSNFRAFFDSVFKRIRSKKRSGKNKILWEALSSILRVTCVVTLMYFCLFRFH